MLMKKVLKITAWVSGIVLAVAGGVVLYVGLWLPNAGKAPDLHVALTEDRVARGRYLANHVMVCMDCHSGRDWGLFSGPLKPGTLGMGGEVFDQNLGFPGRFVSGNLTPYALGNWTDGEIFRAITSGVNRDGKALFPVMPYHNYGMLNEADIRDIIAYLRSLEPVQNDPPESKADFPMNLIINTMPKKPSFQSIPDSSDKPAYGRYLVTAAGCVDCHTRQEKGKFTGKALAGGFDFPLPGGSVVTSSNITPHETGIGNWTEAQFIRRFKLYADSGYSPHKTGPADFQTVMPWTMYAHMHEQDLSAVYAYLRTVEAVDNRVQKFRTGR